MDEAGPENPGLLEQTVAARRFVHQSFSENCFEPDSAIAASMGVTKRRRLKQEAIPTIFDKPVQPPNRNVYNLQN